MGETTDQIEAHIEMTRQHLHANFRELAQRLKAATDWRRQVRNHPMTLIAASFAAGVLLAALLAGTTGAGTPPGWAWYRRLTPQRQRAAAM